MGVDIQSFCGRRKIYHLLHFTRAENLHSILAHGLLSRKELEEKGAGISCTFNDPERFDRRTEATCCSLGWPNYKMFYTLRCENSGVDWVVLKIDKSVLWENKCLFCYENAAAKSMCEKEEKELAGVDALERLFDDEEARTRRKLPSFYPTHPQAEVLVYGRIDIAKIRALVFEDEKTMAKYNVKGMLLREKMSTRESCFFGPRKDHREWKDDGQ